MFFYVLFRFSYNLIVSLISTINLQNYPLECLKKKLALAENKLRWQH